MAELGTRSMGSNETTGNGTEDTGPELEAMSRVVKLVFTGVCGRNISANPFSSGGAANRCS